MSDQAMHINTLTPPATIGMLGSGQLGRMFTTAAKQMGYRVVVFSPSKYTPTGQLADKEITADYLDLDAVRAFAQEVDVITYEFENVPLATALAAAEIVPVHPNPNALATAQNRIREKLFMRENGLPVAPFVPIQSLSDFEEALTKIGLPAVLKTAESGYDGKGQVKIEATNQAAEAWEVIGQKAAVLEGWVTFEKEISVVGARDIYGNFAHYGAIENDHRNHILDVSMSPADVPPETINNAVKYAQMVLENLDVVGVLCVEFFMKPSGELLINEIAPRPHNSGHLTIESHVTSQFEQQLRTICGLPVGNTAQLKPGAMVNLLGELWPANNQPNWAAVCTDPRVKLHLYGKAEARPGRKMGHLTALGETSKQAAQTVLAAREKIQKSNVDKG